jgi:hypothetical protein
MAEQELNSMNTGLTAAKTAKKDEFYTQYVDIQKEVEAYLEYDPDTFRDKTVYCNCDDPFESNFFKYFAANFNRLGLRKLISTSYDGSSIAGAQVTFDEYTSGNGAREKPKAICIEIEEVTDLDGDGATGIEDVKLFLENNPHSRTPLDGGGDVRSDECIELLEKADIVVTNPPFSLFREFMSLLTERGKNFLAIGNTNAITYKEIFPLVSANRLWLGCTNFNVGMFFVVPDHWEKFHHIDEVTGKKIARVSTSCWYTNLDHGRRHSPLSLMTMDENLKFNKKLAGRPSYRRYDNYNAIEIPFYDAIPSDYAGVMGVPVTFLDKYSPEQFEIVGTTESNDKDNAFRTRHYTAKECRDAYANRFGKTGVYDLNASGVVEGVKVYKRILIRHRGQK